MGERDFDDEDRRQLERGTKIVLRDGREFTPKQIFKEFVENKFEKDYMPEAFYRLIMQTPIKVAVSSQEDKVSIDIERYFKKRRVDREKSTPVEFSINGVSSEDPKFSDELERIGEVFVLKWDSLLRAILFFSFTLAFETILVYN